MKMNNLNGKITALVVIGVISLLTGCQDEDRLTVADTKDIVEEALTDSYFQDMDDMAGVAINAPTEDAYNSGGRVATTITITDERMSCDGIVISIEPRDGSTLDTPRGVMVVDFGITGCPDARGNIRTGKIIFTYEGKRFQPGSTVVTTVDNYTINGVKLEGTRTLTNVTGSNTESPRFNAVLENGKATFVTDGTFAERESNITWQWHRGQTFADDYLEIDQSSTANGVTRAGRTYAVSLSKALKYKRFCGIAVEGIKIYVIDGSKKITVDYGDGECDKKVTVLVEGKASSLTI
jgi:hypothetical protein